MREERDVSIFLPKLQNKGQLPPLRKEVLPTTFHFTKLQRSAAIVNVDLFLFSASIQKGVST